MFLLDEIFGRMYRAERRLSRVISTLAVASVLIALLGVFGLTAYMAGRRTKEAGIRKVLGASTFNLVRLLSRDMLGPVLIANLMAWPLAYLFIRQWLMDFAYRVDISLWVFIVAGLALTVLTQLTVGYHAVKTARTNPVETWRYAL
jgi:putative ABC transport system permease protein